MSERKTFMAASVDDAITEATLQLQIPSDKLGYEVIDKGAKGFLGIGSRQAVIEAWEITEDDEKPAKKEAPAEKKAAAAEKAADAVPILEDIAEIAAENKPEENAP